MNRPYVALLASAILSVSGAAAAYAAADTKDPYEDNLLGNWGGHRGKLADAGVDVTLAYTADIQALVDGGLNTGSNYLDNIDLRFDIDGEKLFGIKGNKAALHFINNVGGKPNNRVGSQQGINNIEVPKNGPRVYEAWDEQSFFDGKLAILLGLHELNNDFMVTESSDHFISPVFQFGQTFAQSGQNGPPVFPFTALAARAKFLPTDATYVMAGVYDGVAGDPDHQYGNQFQFDGGLLLIAEAGCTPEGLEGAMNKHAIGAWMYTHSFPDQIDATRERSYGAYVLASHELYREKSGRVLTGFIRPGMADGKTAPLNWEYETGVVGTGWISERPDSELGLGFTHLHNSSNYIRSVIAGGGTSDRNEYGLELYYRDKLYKGVMIQPDIQYIINPGTTPQVDNATIIGVRLEINF